MSGYKMKKSLGSGSFGEVFMAEKDGKCFAIKKLKNTDPTAQQEIQILSSVNDPNIIKYFGHFWESGMMCIVLEYADKGTFEKQVLGNIGAEEYNVWRALSNLSGGLQYLHAKRPNQILHRDLKPDNILGVSEWSNDIRMHGITWKLADFGVAKLLKRDAQEAYYGAAYEGVPTYMAPEVYKDYELYSDKSDVWALGCLMAFYLNKRHMFYTPDTVEAYGGQTSLFADFTHKKYSKDLIELVFKMMNPDENKRPTAKEVAEETFFNDRQHV